MLLVASYGTDGVEQETSQSPTSRSQQNDCRRRKQLRTRLFPSLTFVFHLRRLYWLVTLTRERDDQIRVPMSIAASEIPLLFCGTRLGTGRIYGLAVNHPVSGERHSITISPKLDRQPSGSNLIDLLLSAKHLARRIRTR